MLSLQPTTKIIQLALSLLIYSFFLTNTAQAVSVEALYSDCKKALILSGGKLGNQKVSPEDKAKYFMSFFKCGGYINGALEMKRTVGTALKTQKPYCSPKKAVLNLTVAVQLFVTFVEAGKKTASKEPAAEELVKALSSVLNLEGPLAKKFGCFPKQ